MLLKRAIEQLLENTFSNTQAISGELALKEITKTFKITKNYARPIVREWLMKKANFN